ncbi:hypothetical protein C2E23DRAFT_900756 [Lenzites betulinus]|nr:hypothetical protein C2E23DRAFT_900756 [Lenzites betulinus]
MRSELCRSFSKAIPSQPRQARWDPTDTYTPSKLRHDLTPSLPSARCKMSCSPIATTSITDSGHHHTAGVRRPHGGSPSSAYARSAFICLQLGTSFAQPSFRVSLPSPSSSAPLARWSRGRRGNQRSKRSMGAARPKLVVEPSGKEGAWGTADELLSTSSSSRDLQASSVAHGAAGQTSATGTKCKSPTMPQPSVKKMRRRVALLSGIHLNLPNSPISGPSPPVPSPEMAWTFTAEWDSTHDEIVFSEVENANPSFTPSTSSTSSSSSLRLVASPVPSDVEEDEIFDFDVLSAAPLSQSSSLLSDMVGSSSRSPSSPSSPFSPSMSIISEIFDSYMHTPYTMVFSHRERRDSVSTAPSSPVGPASPVMQSPPSYSDSRYDQPVISVTFHQESEDPARSTSPFAPLGMASGSGLSAEDPYSCDATAFAEGKIRMLPQTPSPSPVARRPLPPVPVRASSMAVSAARPVAHGASISSVWFPQGAMGRPSLYSPPVPSPLHTRAASLG